MLSDIGRATCICCAAAAVLLGQRIKVVWQSKLLVEHRTLDTELVRAVRLQDEYVVCAEDMMRCAVGLHSPAERCPTHLSIDSPLAWQPLQLSLTTVTATPGSRRWPTLTFLLDQGRIVVLVPPQFV